MYKIKLPSFSLHIPTLTPYRTPSPPPPDPPIPGPPVSFRQAHPILWYGVTGLYGITILAVAFGMAWLLFPGLYHLGHWIGYDRFGWVAECTNANSNGCIGYWFLGLATVATYCGGFGWAAFFAAQLIRALSALGTLFLPKSLIERLNLL